MGRRGSLLYPEKNGTGQRRWVGGVFSASQRRRARVPPHGAALWFFLLFVFRCPSRIGRSVTVTEGAAGGRSSSLAPPLSLLVCKRAGQSGAPHGE